MYQWRKKVYHLPIKQKLKVKSKHWISLRKKVFKRDRYQCQRCKKFYLEDGLQLTAHHIIPRPKGKTISDNLITLCNTCHDIVEVNGFDFDIDAVIIESKPTANTLDWHKWVYGGYDKPYK